MSGFTVTAGQLKKQAGTLRELNARFKSTVGDLESLEGRLGGMWDGEAKNAFHNAFSSDKIQMNNFYNAIENYVQRLEAIAGRYEMAEGKNLEIANTRKYK